MSTVPSDLPSLDEKVCTKCGEMKPLTEYYVKDKKTGRRYSWCGICHTAITSARAKADPARHCAYAKAWRHTNREKALAQESAQRDKHREALNQRAREYRARPDVKVKKAEYRKAHDAERKAYNARYREEHAEEIRTYNERYYQENAERVGDRIRESIAKNPEKYRKIHSDWKKRNKDAVNASGNRRRAREKSNGGSWSAADWQRVKARYDWRCLMCDRQEMTDGIRLCFDHVVPISMGGLNIIANGQPLCRSCNSKKHAKVLDLRPDFYRV